MNPLLLYSFPLALTGRSGLLYIPTPLTAEEFDLILRQIESAMDTVAQIELGAAQAGKGVKAK